MGTLHEDQYTFSIILRSVLLRIKNISDLSCRETRNTHFVFYNFFCFSFENRAIYEIMWKNIVERGRPQMIIWRMRIACWIPKATNAHTGCVFLIFQTFAVFCMLYVFFWVIPRCLNFICRRFGTLPVPSLQASR